MNKRHLSPKERIEAVTGPGEPDRVPVLTYSNHFQVRWAVFTYGEVMRDEDKFIEAQLSALDHFNYDGITNLGGPGMIAESLGADLIVAEEESPSMTEPGLTGERDKVDPDELLQLSVARGEYVRQAVKVTEKLSTALGDEVPLIGSISSPFRELCLLRGFELVFMDMVGDPPFVADLVGAMEEKVFEYASLLVEAGADIVGMTDPFANSAMISYEQYREVVHPFEESLIDRVHEETGAKVLFHTCGEWGDRFDAAVGAGADIYHVDGVGEVSLGQLTEKYAGETAIMGRLNTTGLLLNGSPERVRQAARVSLNEARGHGNYVLGGNCSLAPDTPPENLRAMVEVAHEEVPSRRGENLEVDEMEVYSW